MTNTAKTEREQREPMTQAEINSLHFHPSWDDGRYGYLHCRFDAMLTPDDDPRYLRAEITWEEEDGNPGPPTNYVNPELWIETNRKHPEGGLQTIAGRKVKLTRIETTALLLGDPTAILTRYADLIAKLPVPDRQES
jgi:hypothetical protein